jgi:glycerophosphoryl diester phosphodiesterase
VRVTDSGAVNDVRTTRSAVGDSDATVPNGPALTAPPIAPTHTLTRRVMLGSLGVGALAVAGGGWWLVERERGPAWRHRRISTASWRTSRGPRYLVAHRGCGDVRPEHTIQAYDAALNWGAQALEISTSSTSDGVLICMHDLTYDRTTTGTGAIHAQPATVLNRIGVRQPQLGPAWMRSPLPRVPRLDEALSRYGGHAVLCLEAKRDEDYDAMMSLVSSHRLRDSVIIKAFHTSDSIDRAKAAGFPVFAYLGPSDADTATVSALAARLDRGVDSLVLPTTGPGGARLDSTVVTSAVSSGIATWAYPVHRRAEAAYFADLGAQAAVTSSFGYSAGGLVADRHDRWSAGAIVPGEITRDPPSTTWAPRWEGGGVLTLAAPAGQHFLTLGQFAPLPHGASRYRVDLEARWNALPDDATSHLDLIFGHADDRYYEHRSATADGYHAILRTNGSLELYSHTTGVPDGQQLASPVDTPAPAAGEWLRLRLEVDGDRITFSRLNIPSGTATVAAADGRYRGHYLHIGRADTGSSASASFRSLKVS